MGPRTPRRTGRCRSISSSTSSQSKRRRAVDRHDFLLCYRSFSSILSLTLTPFNIQTPRITPSTSWSSPP